MAFASFAKRAISVGWKMAIPLAVAGFVIWRLRFAPVPVQSHVAAMGPVVAETMGTGTLEPRVQATLSAKIPGRIAQVLADQGDRVSREKLLATLDDGELRQQVEMAKAELAATKAGVDRAGAEISRADATAIEARAAYARNAKLHNQKLLSDAELDKATQLRDVAEAELRRAQLSKIEMERQVTKAEETLRYYDERLADTKIASPFDGLIIRRSREPGDIVVPGSAILQIISTEEMWVSAWVDESAMSSLNAGQPARVVFRSQPGQSFAGTVSRLAPLADRETREFLVDVTVKELPKNWAVGQRAEVYIQTAKKDQALLVPQSAIIWEKGKPAVFVESGGRAQLKNVELGVRGDRMVEIVKGVTAGRTVIWPRDAKAAALTEGRAVSLP